VTSEAWVLLAAGVLLVLVAWTAWTLVRLRRLERRTARAWTALAAQLQRRAGLAEELARNHPAAVGEGVAARLAATAAEARAPRVGDRELAENALGHALRELPPDLPGVPTALQEDLAGTTTRVGLARRFYNDAVRDTRAVRRHRLLRTLHLRTGGPLPPYFDIDDRLGEVVAGADRGGGPPA
jgi:hypothetical protein